jgi:hypothetical protein
MSERLLNISSPHIYRGDNLTTTAFMTALTNDSAFSVGPFENEQAAQLAEISIDINNNININNINYEINNVNIILILLISNIKNYIFKNNY